MKVLIVGGGIAGFALAAFLRDTSIECHIVEKNRDWSHEGFLIGLWDNGRDILKKLELAERLDAKGSRVRTNTFRDGAGREIRRFNLSPFYSEYGGAVTIIGRGDIHAWLRERSAAPVRMGMELTGLAQDEESVRATFADGTTETYDVVIGADGVRSRTRELVFSSHAETYTNWRAWYVWIETQLNAPDAITEYIEGGECITVFTAGGRTLATMFAPADHNAWDTKEGRVERLKTLFNDETSLVPRIFEHVRDEDVLPTDLADVHLSVSAQGRVALIGDAAYSTGPVAGLGSSMALEDAYVLAAELQKTTDVFAALKAYDLARRPRRAIARRLSLFMRSGSFVSSRGIWAIAKQVVRWIPDRIALRDYRTLLEQEI